MFTLIGGRLLQKREAKIVAQLCMYVFVYVENVVGKGKNAGYQYFLLFAQCFRGLICQVCSNSRFCCKDIILFEKKKKCK